MNVLIAAEEAAGSHALRLLARSGQRIVTVLTSGAEGSGAAVAAEARRLGLPTEPPERVRDPALAGEMRAAGVDLLLNVHSLYLVHDAILEAPRIGCFNLHPGPLPEYAGLDAPSWAIYRGESAHGVTLHWMVPRIDAGPVAYEARFPIAENDTGLSLSLKCVQSGLPLIERLLDDAARGADGIPRRTQELDRRRYYRRRPPQGGRIDWAVPADRIAAFVRACDYAPFPSPWGHPLTALAGRELRVAKAAASCEPCTDAPGTVGPEAAGGARVAASDAWVVIARLQVEGRYLDAREILRPGMRLCAAV
jgi:UDP-4-amino-4-deoxy-L-arabinose formyltransferase/UDP-glucuronic acid dehydrogenase (UDP-4-keto-hexauronic acid decarboxylating)